MIAAPPPGEGTNGMLRRDFLKAIVAVPSIADARTDSTKAGVAFRAGVARVDITPSGPVCLHGYLEPASRVSAGVHDRLYARAFAFSVGAQSLVIVACDLGTMDLADYWRRSISETSGLGSERIWLCASHTHSGPLLTLHPSYPDNVAYTKRLTRVLTQVVAAALRARRPARLAFGTSQSHVGVSRRLIMPDGRVEMRPNPAGIADPEVAALHVTRTDGTGMGTLFAYACHSRSLRAPNRLVSGDVLGIAAQEVERASGPGAIVGALAGASGDIDPGRVVDGFDGEGGAPVDQGRDLGRGVSDALERATPRRVERLRSSIARVVLPPKHPGHTRAVRVATATFGDLAIVGLDCEASTEIGLAIKAASPFGSTFVVTNCNGWSGYLPVARQYAEGGYEVDRSGFGPDAASQLVDSVTRTLRAL
jgi:hypothetical protein